VALFDGGRSCCAGSGRGRPQLAGRRGIGLNGIPRWRCFGIGLNGPHSETHFLGVLLMAKVE
jgi:hypothetical protein